MATGIEKLTALKVMRLSKPGRYADGNGLYLQITKALVKSWLFRYERNGKERQMGLGPTHTIGLAEAREAARQARICLVGGLDPLDERAARLEANRAQQRADRDFDQCAAEYIKSRQGEWKSEKHRKQWESTLAVHASPHIGKLAVRRIDTPLVLNVLRPIWTTKTETASRVRERIERILTWAAKHGFREGDNPARWEGHLEELLPKPSRLKKVIHHPAMDYREVGAFLQKLRSESGFAARALEFTILTACRTGEVLGATWQEFDLRARVWTIPAERMKNNKEHRVPLAASSLEVLKKVRGAHGSAVFPGGRQDGLLSDMAMLKVLQRMGRSDVTVHGFRSAFRDWAAELTQHPEAIAEMCLAHTVGSAVENAYRRSDLFNRRKDLMEDWSNWCSVVQPLDRYGQEDDRYLLSRESNGVSAEIADPRELGGLKDSSAQQTDPRLDPRPAPGFDGLA